MHAHTLAVLGVFLAGALHAAEPVVTKLMFKPSGPAPQEIVTVPAGTVLEVLSYRKGSGEDAFVRVAAGGNEVSVADPTGLVMAGPISLQLNGSTVAHVLVTYRLSANKDAATNITVDMSALKAPLTNIATAIKTIKKVK